MKVASLLWHISEQNGFLKEKKKENTSSEKRTDVAAKGRGSYFDLKIYEGTDKSYKYTKNPNKMIELN